MDKKQFFLFVLASGTSAIVNMFSRYILNYWLPFSVAIVVAYLFGMATAYVLGRRFVFEKSGRAVMSEVWRFCLVNFVSVAQVWVISMALGEMFFPAIGFKQFPLELAHFIGLASLSFTSYLLHRHFSFAKNSVK